MYAKFLSGKNYKTDKEDYGDCILIDNGKELVLYDCGSVEHAKRVIQYMDDNHYEKVKIILSHNDKDHFDGIPYLIENNRVSSVYTLLLFKYKEELIAKIKDGRITKESLTRRISEMFGNISSLSEKVALKDIFTDTHVCTDITIVGPSKEYALEAIAKRIDNRQGDTIDNETIVNAVSTQVKIKIGSKKLFLCGDSSYEAIKDQLDDCAYIQLPHHGKEEQANQIFDQCGSVGKTYYVSDNKGNANGGSENLPKKGYKILNTKDKDQECKESNNTTTVKRKYFNGF